MVAAVLHLDEGAGAAGESVDQMGCGFLDRHDVVDDCLWRVCEPESGARLRPGRGAELFGVAEHLIGLGHGDESFRLGLRGAAGDDDFG